MTERAMEPKKRGSPMLFKSSRQEYWSCKHRLNFTELVSIKPPIKPTKEKIKNGIILLLILEKSTNKFPKRRERVLHELYKNIIPSRLNGNGSLS